MGTGRSVNANQYSFARVPGGDVERSTFNRSHGRKSTFDAGWLVPVYVDETLPGDVFNLKMTNFTRLATLQHPVMDNMYLESFFFAVPMRLLWTEWEKFNGAQDNPGDSTVFQIPGISTPTGYAVGSLEDHLGIPPGVLNINHSAMFHRAYNLIWNEWFRDENLQDSVATHTHNGPDDPADYQLLRRGKRHDYFSASLPWPQKGQPVQLPIGTSAPVVPVGNFIPQFQYGNEPTIASLQTTANNSPVHVSGTPSPSGGILSWSTTALEADLSSATAATINEIRTAFQIQRLYERDARGGTRYTEIIRSHFGVISPDARLQRPEFLGGGTQRVNVTAVPNTAGNLTTPQGNLAAYGVSTGSDHRFSKSFTEHCIILGLVSVRADLNYQQGLNRMFSRSTRWEFFWPALAHLGEQEVFNREIYLQGTSEDTEIWGYQERYAEYRYKPSEITGSLRSTVNPSLDTWHLAQHFTSLPQLNSTFIEENPPIDRIIAVQNEPQFIFDAFFDLKCTRPMPTYGVPGMVDHF
ncbi:major capsid protein [Microviridae sp.]|nr:major capsid protein [Microviridae sp.]